MEIKAHLLRASIDKLAAPLTNIFNSLLKKGTFPEKWRESFLIPIPKPGKPQKVENYRGICIQSIIPKIFDDLLTQRIRLHMESLIPKSQHGFVRKKGTTTNLLETVHFIGSNITIRGQVDAVYIDLSKAFDKISHRKLLRKLCAMSMPINYLKCLALFICNRKYHLKINGSLVNISHVSTSAVPQGSHVGPLMFILFCADMVTCTEGTNIQLLSYADDTKIFGSIKSMDERNQLQRVLDKMVTWCETNKLSINPSKTVHVTYSRTKHRTLNTIYFIGAGQIVMKNEIRDLGVIFD